MKSQFVDGKTVVIVTRLPLVINVRNGFKWTVIKMVLRTYVDLTPDQICEWGGF